MLFLRGVGDGPRRHLLVLSRHALMRGPKPLQEQCCQAQTHERPRAGFRRHRRRVPSTGRLRAPVETTACSKRVVARPAHLSREQPGKAVALGGGRAPDEAGESRRARNGAGWSHEHYRVQQVRVVALTLVCSLALKVFGRRGLNTKAAADERPQIGARVGEGVAEVYRPSHRPTGDGRISAELERIGQAARWPEQDYCQDRDFHTSSSESLLLLTCQPMTSYSLGDGDFFHVWVRA